MSLEHDIKGLESWSSYKLSINTEGYAPLSGKNSLYESYLDFMSNHSLEALPLKTFCTDMFLLYALKYNVFLKKHRRTRGIIVHGLELSSEPITKSESNNFVTYNFK